MRRTVSSPLLATGQSVPTALGVPECTMEYVQCKVTLNADASQETCHIPPYEIEEGGPWSL